MRRILLLFPALLLSAFLSRAAVPEGKVVKSVDPEGDRIAFARYRAKMDEIRKKRPTVALVMSGGSMYGLSHIGVLKYLQEHDIPVDMVLGTSMGSIVGFTYALGYNPGQIDSIVSSLDWSMMMSDKVDMDLTPLKTRRMDERYTLTLPVLYKRGMYNTGFVKEDRKKFIATADVNKELRKKAFDLLPDGFVWGLSLQNELTSLSVGYHGFDDYDFSELPVPFVCVASDLATLKAKYWTSGSVVEAARSSMSLPVFFKPVRKDGLILEDGGMRNNFPVDVAKACGADYVIGVNVLPPVDPENVTSIGSVLNQIILLTRNESDEYSRANSSVLIEPDMTGIPKYGFNSANVRRIIEQGYATAAEHAEELEGLKEKLGCCDTYRTRSKATDINGRKVMVNDIAFDGLDPKEIRYFMKKVRLKPGREYGREELEEMVSVIYGTGAYTSVTYRLYGNEPYSLHFSCMKGASHLLSVGLKADNEEKVSVGARFGFNANKLIGNKFDAEIAIGDNNSFFFDYHFDTMYGPRFGASVKTKYTSCIYFDPSESVSGVNHYSWNNYLKVYMADTRFKVVDIRGGFELENMPYALQVAEDPIFGSGEDMSTTRKIGTFRPHYGLFAEFATDTFNDGYFPTKGINFAFSYRFKFADSFKDIPCHIVAASVKAALSCGQYFAILPSVSARWISTSPGFILDNNVIGGIVAGRYLDHQIPFVGYTGLRVVREPFVAVADVDLRGSINAKNFLTLTACAMEGLGDFSLRNAMIPVYSFAGSYGLKTIAGPLIIGVNWSSDLKWGWFASFGYYF